MSIMEEKNPLKFLVLLTLKFTLTGKVVIVRTPLDIPLLLLLAVKIVSSIFLLLMGVTIALTGTWATWIAGALGTTLVFATSNQAKQLSKIGQIRPIGLFGLIGLIIPLALVAAVATLSFIPPIV